MAILNSLIVNGSIRCLNKLYVRDIDLSNDLSVNEITAKGNIVANGELFVGHGTEGKAKIYLNKKLFAQSNND